jgi:hypothetical protein
MNLGKIFVTLSRFLTPYSVIRTGGIFQEISLVSFSKLLQDCFNSWEEAGVWPSTASLKRPSGPSGFLINSVS